MNPVEQLLAPVLEVQSALVGTDGPSARDAQARGQAAATADSGARHDALAAQGDKQADAAGAGYDAPTIAELDNWQAWQLEEMRALLDAISPDAMAETGSTWQALGSQIADSFETFRREVTEAVAETWTGPAATAAEGYCTAFAQWGSAFGAAVDGTGIRIHQAAAAVDLAKINLPEPQDFNWQRLLVVAAEGAIIGGVVGAIAGAAAGPAGIAAGAALGAAAGGAVGGGGDVFKQFVEQQQAQQRGAEVMERFYSKGYVDVDSTTPAFATAVSSTSPGAAGTSASSFGQLPGGGGSAGITSGLSGGGPGSGADSRLGGGFGAGAGMRPAGRGGIGAGRGAGGRAGGLGGPFGGGGGARGQGDEDEERLTKFVQKDDGLFASDEPCARPIIGV
ncbi:PPE family protein [Actinokineospora alba]|uniref:PPE family protein n=1 Tax=Actinokineospora alba TaxID=504798 RepID=A0A1H0ILL1_9PSEU|nr:PPE domain-containing protein [Actinokineospora alba]TDP70892.1 PPE family protein [Actinokineospora alba]SDI90713.1 PPE family protein [Actinokineospora alba]SDO32302.1 PPE family protein [Actinokineospora alba]